MDNLNAEQQYDKAIADYTEVIRLDSNYAFAYLNHGNKSTEKAHPTKLLPITLKQSGSILIMPLPPLTVEWPTTTKRNTTKPLATSMP